MAESDVGEGTDLPEGREEADSSSGAGGVAREEMAAIRPILDRIQMELARAKAEERLFGKTERPKVGRFELLGDISTGGMGVVYGAFDPQLARRVALKLLHPQAPRSLARRERLLAEARALARLHHPNVVAVYDAVIFEEQVVVVMEWVEGQTLARWEKERVRGWREVVDAYAQAGRGLAAVHALGLVHRDFKPANAIVGDDGRVRILDFGLASFHDAPSDSDSGSGSDSGSDLSLTATGEVLGTLPFMAPEQLAGGGRATSASDQFSFCVALYRALFSAPPYPGTTVEELLAGMAHGPADPTSLTSAARPARSIPAGLRAAILRGLSVDPASRFPEMEALLDELSRERGWRRFRTPLVAGVAALVAAGLAFALSVNRTDRAACDGGAVEIATSWGAAQREELARAFARASGLAIAGKPREAHSADIERAVASGLDTYRHHWSAMHRAACQAHRGGSQSDALLDRRMQCLRRRKDALVAAAVALGQLDSASLERAREVVARLPPIADCGELDLLAAAVEPPASAQARAEVASVEAKLAQAVALERLGRSSDALTRTRALLAEATRLAYPPLEVELLLTEGRIALSRDELADAQKPLLRAEELGLSHGLLPQAIVAAARRLYAEARTGADLPGLLRQAAVLEPLSRNLRGDAFARPLLLNNLGVVHQAMGQRERAFDAFSRARQALANAPRIDLELTVIDRNVAMLTRESARREQLARGVWESLRAQLGERHLRALEALMVYSRYVDDPAVARPLSEAACKLFREVYPELSAMRLQCESHRGFLASELGEPEAAAGIHDEVAAIIEDATAPRAGGPGSAPSKDLSLSTRLHLARGWAALLRGQAAEARRGFTQALALATDAAWWWRAWAAQAELGIGLALLDEKKAGAALSHLRRAIAIYRDVSEVNEETEHKRRLAMAQLALVRAQRALPSADASSPEEERQAARDALAFYERASPSAYRQRIEELRGQR